MPACSLHTSMLSDKHEGELTVIVGFGAEGVGLCVDALHTLADDLDVGLQQTVLLQQVVDAHQVLAVVFRLQAHLQHTQTRDVIRGLP